MLGENKDLIIAILQETQRLEQEKGDLSYKIITNLQRNFPDTDISGKTIKLIEAGLLEGEVIRTFQGPGYVVRGLTFAGEEYLKYNAPILQLEENTEEIDDHTSKQWDVFIAYASEDRESVAGPLAKHLGKMGVTVWFDQTELNLGDSLREKVDEGLANCRYGIVILSKYFFGKHYPKRELNGLAQREIDGEKVILPIWQVFQKTIFEKFRRLWRIE